MTTDTSLKDAIEQQTNPGFFAWLISRQIFWILLAVVIAVVAMMLLTTTFATPNNLFNVTRNFAFVGIVGLGMTAVIVTGGIDLSVGATVLISAMVTTLIMHSGLPITLALPAAIGAALLVGLINGLLIAVAGMPAFVVTLGMMSIARSIGMVMSNNALIYEFGPDQPILFSIGGGSVIVGGLPIPARPDRLVIEVADHVHVDTEVLAGIHRLRERGYRIAIPGFVSRPGQRQLLPYADFVKIDVRDLDVEGRPVVELARSHGALLIAEFVERRWMLSHSRDLGFDFFQGNLLERATVLDRSTAPWGSHAG